MAQNFRSPRILFFLELIRITEPFISRTKVRRFLAQTILKDFYDSCSKSPDQPFLRDIININRAYKEYLKARDKMVVSNLRLVAKIAGYYIGKGVDYMDLIQEGNSGLMWAAEKFEYSKGYKFSTYAKWWIIQNVSRCIADSSRTIRVPVYIHETIVRIAYLNRISLAQLGRTASSEEISSKLGITQDSLDLARRYMNRTASLDQKINNGSDKDDCLMDLCPDPAPNPEEICLQDNHNKALEEKIKSLLDCLDKRSQTIIRMRFGIGYDKTYTLEEVGNHFGITREGIRQLQNKAIKIIWHKTRNCQEFADLSDFLA